MLGPFGRTAKVREHRETPAVLDISGIRMLKRDRQLHATSFAAFPEATA
jgi:hypothetical protein